MSEAAKVVLAVLRGESPLTVRLLRESESLPESFEAGFDQLRQLDPSWVWVAERRGQIVGCIVSSPCHGVALIWRLVALPGSHCLFALWKRFLKDCRSRKVVGFMALVDPAVHTQGKIQRYLERQMRAKDAGRFVLMAGSMARGGVLSRL